MKKAFLILIQFALFFVIFLGGSLFDPLKLRWFVSHPTPTATRFFVPDGLLLMVVLYLLIVLVEAGMKRFPAAWLSTIGFLLALILGLLSRFGWATHELF